MQTIISEGMLQQRFGSSASCGARRDCLRYPNHEGFKGKRRYRFLMSRFDVFDGLAFAYPRQHSIFREAAGRDIHIYSPLHLRWRVGFCSLLWRSSRSDYLARALFGLVYHLRLETRWKPCRLQ